MIPDGFADKLPCHKAIPTPLQSSNLLQDDRYSVSAVVSRSDNPDDDLIIYEEKPHRDTINWIKSLYHNKI